MAKPTEPELLPATFETMLRGMFLQKQPLTLRVIWKGRQWSNEDGTDAELFDMFRLYGLDCRLEIEPKE